MWGVPISARTLIGGFVVVAGAAMVTASGHSPRETLAKLLSASRVYAASLAEGDHSTPQCKTYCSRDNPGVSVAEIRWTVADKPLTEEGMRSLVLQQSLEVTVYKDGFETGSFAVLPSLTPGRRFTLRTTAEGGAASPGLQRLTLIEVVTSKERPRPDLRLRNTPKDKTESVTAKVEGLEFGVNYFWRVRSLTSTSSTLQVVGCQAATCQVDYVTPKR